MTTGEAAAMSRAFICLFVYLFFLKVRKNTISICSHFPITDWQNQNKKDWKS